MSYTIRTFLLVSSSVSSNQLLCFVQSQDQKREQKHTTQNFAEFHNHSPLLTTWFQLADFTFFQGSSAGIPEVTEPERTPERTPERVCPYGIPLAGAGGDPHVINFPRCELEKPDSRGERARAWQPSVGHSLRNKRLKDIRKWIS